MTRIYEPPSGKGPVWAALATTAIVVVLALTFYLKKGPDAHKAALAQNSGASAATGKSNGFSGHYGYLMSYPASYEVYPQMRGETEVVFFYPKGTKLSTDEKQYKALGIVRLEVVPRMQIKGRSVTSEELKGAVLRTLDGNKETYTVKTLSLAGKPAFQVDITAPNPLIQLFVEGAKVEYAFTGGDELPLQALAENIMETDAAVPSEVSGPAGPKSAASKETSVGKAISGGFIAYGGTYLPMPKGYTAGSRFAPDDQDIEVVDIYPDNMTFAQAQKDSYLTNGTLIHLEIVPDTYTTRKDLLSFAKSMESIMKQQKWQNTSRWLKNSKIPTLMVDVKKPKHVRIFRFTPKATFKFLAAQWTPRLQSIMTGIKEPAPAK